MNPQYLKRLLALGVALGLAGALGEVFAPGPALLPDTIAIVNGEPILRKDYQRTLEGLAQDKKNAIDEQDRAWVLQRIVDEYLLIQRGAELGFAHSEPSVRQALVNAVIQTALEQEAPDEPSDAELQRFYQQNAGYFAPEPQVRVVSMLTPSAQRAALARAALLEGQDPEQVRRQYAVSSPLTTPSGFMPPSRLRIYIGESAVRQLGGMQSGEVTQPIPTGEQFLLVLLLDKKQGAPKPFAEIGKQVEAEYLRRQDERILDDYLKWLYQRADVQYADDAPRP